MVYAVKFQGVVIAVFKNVGHRDYLYMGLVKAFGSHCYEKAIVREVKV